MSRVAERPERPLLPPSLWALVAAIALSRAALAQDVAPRALVMAAGTEGGEDRALP